MKKLSVLIASPGLSGAGLIYDYLLSRNDFTCPFKNYPDDDQQSEFRFVSDPGGLNSLYYGLYKNFSVNNSSYVFKEFEKYINNLKKLSIIKKNKKKFIYTKDFFTEIEKFKTELDKTSTQSKASAKLFEKRLDDALGQAKSEVRRTIADNKKSSTSES